MNRLVLDLDEQMKSEFIHAYPGSLIIETINACNSTCKLCPVGEGRRSRPVRTLDMHTYCRFIDELGPYAESVTLNNWGEPLLDRYLVERIRYAARIGLLTGISSNLQHLTDAAAEDLVTSGLTVIYISLHAASQETYEAYQPGRSFSRVLENVRKLVNARRRNRDRAPKLKALFVHSRKNEHEIATLPDFVRTLGIDGFQVVPISLNGRFIWSDLQMADRGLSEEQFCQELVERAAKWLPKADFITLNKSFPPPNKQRTCDRLWRAGVLNSDGSIAPCCDVFRPENDFGHYVPDRPFREVWNNEKFRVARRSFRTLSPAQPATICSGCPGHDSTEKWRNPIRF
jgi:MoaA/NifB/PqqE/SkfB family radical SAM enzyme